MPNTNVRAVACNGARNGAYDVVIVGAGPGGANLARLLDTNKYSVLLIDGSENHDKVCGGLLSPDAQDVLARYDISLPSDVLSSPQLFSVRTIDLHDGMTAYYRRNYLNMDRRKFDDFMRSLVPDSVTVMRSRCKDIVRDGDGFTLTLTDAETSRVRCRYLVGADGASSIVRRKLYRSRGITQYTAIQQWYPTTDENPYYSCVFDNATSEGCSWIFFKDSHLVFGGAFDRKNGREGFEAQKKKLASLGIVPPHVLLHPDKIEACLVSRPKLSGGVFTGSDGAFLLGEAAGLISPSSFEGISYALLSAEALADAMNRCGNERRILRSYKKGILPLRAKIAVRCVKRPFMYDRILRRAVMKSGITAIKIKKNEVLHHESEVAFE